MQVQAHVVWSRARQGRVGQGSGSRGGMQAKESFSGGQVVLHTFARLSPHLELLWSFMQRAFVHLAHE